MLFYIVHNLIQAYRENWSESQRNCFTFAIGGTLHVLLYVTLQYLARVNSSPYLELLSRFYGFIVLIDAFTMAILYKVYWGRSILNEMSDDKDKWELDEKNHTYTRVEKTTINRKLEDPVSEITNIPNVSNVSDATNVSEVTSVTYEPAPTVTMELVGAKNADTEEVEEAVIVEEKGEAAVHMEEEEEALIMEETEETEEEISGK